MYLAATRSLVSKEAKQIRPWHFQLQYNGASDTRLSTTRYILEPPVSRSYKNYAKSYKVSTKFASLRTLPKSFIFSPLASSTDTTLSMPCLNGQIECSLYSVASECLGPMPNNSTTAWFVKSKRDEADDSLKELFNEEKEKPQEVEKKPESLENLRKKVKSENLKDPSVPPGWEKRK